VSFILDCNYRYSDVFLLLNSSFNVLYRVIAFKQTQTVYTNYLIFLCYITFNLHLLNAFRLFLNFSVNHQVSLDIVAKNVLAGRNCARATSHVPNAASSSDAECH
jgi:hypothetical protein